ncbi:MAG TPA: FAD-dependent monooxygenase [Candidatus Acidoferrum sp.]|nr:FAD-dependent monooxygenase [Candidatus Acidoferrum sp.]
MTNSNSFDVVTVGGGMGGSALAIGMARAGARVLVLEKETRFRDRVRGEGLVPWGVAEARKLGIADLLLQTCAREVPYVEMGFGPRNLVETTPQKEPLLSYCHPEMQEVLLAEAARSGAEVRRGVTVEAIEFGGRSENTEAKRPTVVARNGTTERISARMVIGVDGRGSAVRRWAGFAVEKLPLPFQFAGVQLAGVRWREDMAPFIFNPELGMAVAMVPQTKGRWRSYLGYDRTSGITLQGANCLKTFVTESARAVPIMADAYAQAESVGPLASFDVSESWVAHPYRDGVALLGDAAATSDPTFGQGMATALRSARVLRDLLLSNDDWDHAGNQYAREHDRYFQNTHKVCGWMRTLMQDPCAESAALRQRAMPKIAEDVMRVPDHVLSGPELPADETVRARFFGED